MCALPDSIANWTPLQRAWQEKVAKAVSNSFPKQRGETEEEHKERILDTMRNIGT